MSPLLRALMDSEVSDALLGISGEQQRTRKDIHAVRQRMRRMRQSGAQDNAATIGSFSKLVVLTLYAISGNANLAVEYLQRYKRRYHQIESSAGELTPVVENWVLDVPQDEFNMLLEPQTGRHTKALRCARQFAAEHSAVLFVEKNNEQKGVAPPTEVVMQTLEVELVGARRLAEDTDYDTRQDLRVSRHRAFAWRFRRRWKIALERLRENAYVPLEERREKASNFFTRIEISGLVFDPVFGPLGWPQKAAPKLVAKYGAKSPQGPHFRTLGFDQKIRYKPHFFWRFGRFLFLGKSSDPNYWPTGISGETN